MVSLSKFDFLGEETGQIQVEDVFFEEKGSEAQLIKDYIVAVRANKRQWSACTRGRSEVSHSTKKPFKQKGTGNARQGSLAAPQFRGGGIVFGPKPKFDQHVRINKKEKRTAIRILLAQKIQSGCLVVADDSVFVGRDSIKTKSALEFLKRCNVELRGVLFVDHVTHVDANDKFKKSVRNLTAFRDFVYGINLNGYDVVAARNIVISEKALVEMLEQLTPKKD